MFDIFEWFETIEFYESNNYYAAAIGNFALYALLILLGAVTCILVVGWLLPRIFIRPDYKGLVSRDRGLKKYTFDDGRAIVYEPESESKKFVDQYIVSANNGEKFLKCRVVSEVRTIEYDVIAFDSRDKALDVLAVSDRVGKKKTLTAALSLPTETAYVSLLVKYVNGVRVAKTPTVYYSGIKLFHYVVFSAITNSAFALVIKPIIAEALVAFYQDTQVISDFKTLLFATAISILCSLVVIGAHCSKDIKIKNDSKILALIKKIIKKVRGVRHGKESTANFKRLLSVFTDRKLR